MHTRTHLKEGKVYVSTKYTYVKCSEHACIGGPRVGMEKTVAAHQICTGRAKWCSLGMHHGCHFSSQQTNLDRRHTIKEILFLLIAQQTIYEARARRCSIFAPVCNIGEKRTIVMADLINHKIGGVQEHRHSSSLSKNGSNGSFKLQRPRQMRIFSVRCRKVLKENLHARSIVLLPKKRRSCSNTMSTTCIIELTKSWAILRSLPF